MIDRKTLDQAREWARDNINGWHFTGSDRALAAAEVIRALPDTIVDGDKLREVVADHHIDMSEDLIEALGALLPDPPTMAEIEWDDEEHQLAEATVSELSGRLHEKVLMLGIDDFGNVRSLDPTKREMWSLSPGRLTPTGRKYRLEPESASPRPDGCCGACPETVGGGIDCTCADNPRCPNHQPRPEDVPVGEAWLIDIDGERTVALLGKVDPADDEPTWFTDDGCGYSFDSGNPVARLVPETTEQDEEPDSYPAYTYLDKDGDEWENIDGGWFTGDTHAKRAAKRAYRCGRASLPAEYGPYTRIEKEKK